MLLGSSSAAPAASQPLLLPLSQAADPCRGRKPRINQSKQHWIQLEAGALSVYPPPQAEPGQGDPKRAGIPQCPEGRGSSDDRGFCWDPCVPVVLPSCRSGWAGSRKEPRSCAWSRWEWCWWLQHGLHCSSHCSNKSPAKAALGMLSPGMGGPFPTLHKSASRVSVSYLLLSLFPGILQNSGMSNLFERKVP